MFLKKYSIRSLSVILLVLFFQGVVVAAQEQVADKSVTAPAAETNGTQLRPVDRLEEIRQQTLDRQREAQELKTEVAKEKDEAAAKELNRQLEEVSKAIDNLNASFEQVAINHLDLSVLSEQPAEEFDWKKDLLEITQPLFSSLKEITEKPRRVESLRSQILRHEDQLQMAGQALKSIGNYQRSEPPKIVAEKLRSLSEKWTQRQRNIQGNLEAARTQLATLEGQETPYWEIVAGSVGDFFSGRGLTLLLAVISALLVWVVARNVLRLLMRFLPKLPNPKLQRRREWIVRYSYRLVTVLIVIIAILGVFYARSDVLLLALTLIALVMIVAALRQTLPKYIKEIRILLDFGSVREGERLVYGGIPVEVKSIHAFAILQNPELEGIIRLPLDALVDQVSRPCGEEPWFPSRVGEILLLSDGRTAEVKRQTIEVVQLKIRGSLVNMATVDFLGLELCNLSREGFVVAVTFGIDYQHQAICLTTVPKKMYEALRVAIDASPFAEHFNELLVEFKEAGASSLDYLVILKMKGAAAPDYFTLGRLVQQTLVALCNEEGWIIPFTQVTIHQGEGFEALSAIQARSDGALMAPSPA